MKKLFFLFFILVIIVGSCKMNKTTKTTDIPSTESSSTVKDFKIAWDNSKAIIYARSAIWGFTGNNIRIILSSKQIKSMEGDKNTDYIFYEPSIYYKRQADSLLLYVPYKSDVPPAFNSPIIIQQIEINGADEIAKFEKEYKNLGLEKISVY